ncbi:MAG TPA: DUF1634 domain-containing protein, partial [Gemmataceae bacterium]|nr:DUF1634 domain-containing protein [Gemmataceae bacterium]
SGWLLLGMLLSAVNESMTSIHRDGAIPRAFLAIGIVLLIALPVLRVAIMALIFLLEKDYRFAAISMTVLLIITLGFLLGTMNSHIDFL